MNHLTSVYEELWLKILHRRMARAKTAKGKMWIYEEIRAVENQTQKRREKTRLVRSLIFWVLEDKRPGTLGKG